MVGVIGIVAQNILKHAQTPNLQNLHFFKHQHHSDQISFH